MQGFLLSIGLAVGLEIFAVAGEAGEITGRILITKNITKRRVTLPVYQLRGVSATPAPTDGLPVNEYSRMVVFLESDSPHAANPVSAELAQSHRRFEPEMLIVPVGSTVSFPNADPIFHNVFSLSRAKLFDLGYYSSGQTRLVQFPEPGIVQVYCHLHPNMYAAIVVVPDRWYARPADDGTFSWTGIPSGKYRLVAWHMTAGRFGRELKVAEDGRSEVVMQVPVSDEQRKP